MEKDVENNSIVCLGRGMRGLEETSVGDYYLFLFTFVWFATKINKNCKKKMTDEICYWNTLFYSGPSIWSHYYEEPR